MALSKKINKTKKKIFIEDIINRRFFTMLVIIVLLFSVITIKLYQLMIIDNNKYRGELKQLSYSTVEGSSTPRGRIYDRNYNIIVDNIAVKTIYYKKSKNITTRKEIQLAYKVSPHLNLNMNKLTTDMLKDFYIVKYPKKVEKLITKEEKELLENRKITRSDIEEYKFNRITEEDLNTLTDEDKRSAYLYYLMNKGYTYDDKIIRTNDVTDEEYAYISENNQELTGFNTRLDWERVYPYKDAFKSILGSVGSITSEEKKYYLNLGYALSDRVGTSYLEKQYEEYLHGTKEKYQVVNSTELSLISEGKRGNDIVLTIDINLQVALEQVLIEEITRAKNEANTEFYDHSSVVIQDPSTGEILAMASKQIVNGNIIDSTTTILTSPVTPGSVVKGASILVGYNNGVIKIGENMVDECITIKGTNEKCSSHTLGRINDITALAKSSNVFQWKTAIRMVGQEYSNGMNLNFSQDAFNKYREMYHSFGLGVKTGIDLPVESLGYGSKKDYQAGNLLDFVIGQYETYTTIQLSQYINTIANGGNRMQPRLLKEVHKATEDDSLGKLMYESSPNVLNTVDTKEEYMTRVHEGFYAVTNAPGGYGRGYMDYQYSPAGKTGTSQSFINTDDDGKIDTETITSSFVGYAPSYDPKMSIVVTSPNSSHPNSATDFASLVTMRITKKATAKYFEIYPMQ